MSVRAARHVFSATTRTSMNLRVNASSIRMGARRTNSSHAPKQSNDRTWIIGSALIFGPAFLYLISPSARKTGHPVHHDSHDFPSHEKSKAPAPAQEPEPVVLKDDEGTATEDVPRPEAEDVPKADAAEPSTSTTESISQEHSDRNDDPQSEEVTTQAADSVGAKEKSGTFQESGEEGPTDIDAARQAAKEGTLSKQKAEDSPSS